jgi:hypothetical protein
MQSAEADTNMHPSGETPLNLRIGNYTVEDSAWETVVIDSVGEAAFSSTGAFDSYYDLLTNPNPKGAVVIAEIYEEKPYVRLETTAGGVVNIDPGSGGAIKLLNVPTSDSGLATGQPYTQTLTEIGLSGTAKVLMLK